MEASGRGFNSQLSPAADLTVAVVLILTCLLSVLGNGTVLLVHCRRRKKLRPPELMTINLALCDFGFSLLGLPFFISSSLTHGWMFGDLGCVWYGVQGFVFGVGSLQTTCLISLDRCLKICCLRYGQWLERRHVLLSIALVWMWTILWAVLPALGFGSYGPEPYGTSCTINWWRIRSSQSDRTFILLILTLCFGLPTLAIVASYLSILLTVSRSKRSLSSIPSSSVSRANRDLRFAKMASVVCCSFLLAWLPYAVVSLMSALVLQDPSGPGEPGSTLDRASSSLPPLVTLVPAMLAKSHCMMNPLIYQVMNKEFRDDVYLMVFGPVRAERRRLQSHCRSSSDRSSAPSLGLRTTRSFSSEKEMKSSFSEEPEDTQRNMEQLSEHDDV